MLAAEIGVTEPVARLIYDTEKPVPVAIDARVIADEQKTADLYFNAKLIHTHLDAPALLDASFNESLAG